MARKPRNAPSRRDAAAKPPQRPSRLGLWLRKRRAWLRPAGIGLLALGGVGAAALAILALDPAARLRDAAQALAGWGRGPGLSVQELRIEGREFTPREALLAAIGTLPGEPILDFDPHAAKQRLEEIAWVDEAHVERRLPGTVLVRIKERRAFAVWQRDGRFSVIDREGRVMATERLDAFGPLPLVVGAGAERHAGRMVELVRDTPALADRVQALVRVSERRWNIRLTNGADILLPEDHEEAALARIAELHARDKLLDRPLATLDLRLPDRMVVRLQNQPAPAPQPAASTTPSRTPRG